MSLPYRKSGKVEHRGWFSPGELARLVAAAYKRTPEVGGRPYRWKWESAQFHDYLLFMSNRGLRPDEWHASNCGT